MARLDPTSRLHRERAGRSLRWIADELAHVRLTHEPYLPRPIVRELEALHGPVYRLSRLVDPTLLAADRERLRALVRRARALGSAVDVAGLSLEELGELLSMGDTG